MWEVEKVEKWRNGKNGKKKEKRRQEPQQHDRSVHHVCAVPQVSPSVLPPHVSGQVRVSHFSQCKEVRKGRRTAPDHESGGSRHRREHLHLSLPAWNGSSGGTAVGPVNESWRVCSVQNIQRFGQPVGATERLLCCSAQNFTRIDEVAHTTSKCELADTVHITACVN